MHFCGAAQYRREMISVGRVPLARKCVRRYVSYSWNMFGNLRLVNRVRNVQGKLSGDYVESLRMRLHSTYHGQCGHVIASYVQHASACGPLITPLAEGDQQG